MTQLALSIDNTPIPIPPGVPSFNSGTDAINKIIGVVVPFLMIAAVLIALGFLIWGGIDYMMSGGDKNKIHSARDKIIYSIVGLIVVFLAFFIINIVGGIIGVQLY